MTDFDFMAGIVWRDLVLVAAAVIAIYLALSVMRLLQMASRRRRAAQQSPVVEFSAAEPHVPVVEPQASSWPPAPVPEFAAELARSNVESELHSLRRECAQLREGMARLTEDVARIKATGNMSPLYNEAMVLAQQGMPADGIAGHCGISIGEAELVAALARGGSQFERHEPGEDRDERNTDSGNRPHG